MCVKTTGLFQSHLSRHISSEGSARKFQAQDWEVSGVLAVEAKEITLHWMGEFQSSLILLVISITTFESTQRSGFTAHHLLGERHWCRHRHRYLENYRVEMKPKSSRWPIWAIFLAPHLEPCRNHRNSNHVLSPTHEWFQNLFKQLGLVYHVHVHLLVCLALKVHLILAQQSIPQNGNRNKLLQDLCAGTNDSPQIKIVGSFPKTNSPNVSNVQKTRLIK